MNCQNCGATLSGTERVCPYCGAATGVSQPNTNYGDNYNRQQQTQHVYHHHNGSVQQSNYGYHPEEHVSTGGWIGRSILLAIPILNVILLLVWGFGGSSKRSLVTYARAQLILTLIGILIAVIVAAIAAASGWNFAAMFNR
ncbi:MAG: hypothetical protein IJ598_00140 [Ruminococcus sp.]|nr:hypothetical protein [Ruminococcus sp.]